MLLSGRSCSQIFEIAMESVEDVLWQSAVLLAMDPDTVVRNGNLMIGSTDIKDLKDCISEELGKLQPLFNFKSITLRYTCYSYCNALSGPETLGIEKYWPNLKICSAARIQFVLQWSSHLSQCCCSIVGEVLGGGLRCPKKTTAYSLKDISTSPFVPIVLTNLSDDGRGGEMAELPIHICCCKV